MNKSSTSIKVLYFTVFAAFLILFTVVKFPREEFKKSLVAKIEQSSPIPVMIESVDYSMPLSLNFNKVNFILKNRNRVQVDSLTVKPSIISLITSDVIKVPFNAKVYQGTIKGDIYYSKKDKTVKSFSADIDSVNSTPLPGLISNDASVKLAGDLDGYIKYNTENSNQDDNSKAYYSITSDNLSINNIRIDQFSFNEDYKNLKLEFMGSLNDRITTIENLSFVNEDFDLRFNGRMPPPWKLKQGGRLDLNMKLNLYSNKAKLALLKAFLSPGTDGSHTGRIMGTVSSPRLVNSKGKVPAGT